MRILAVGLSRLGGTIRRLVHFRVQIADALVPFIVFAPLFVRQAHIGIQFQRLDLFPEKVDKLGLKFFDGVFHTPPTQTVSVLGRRGAQTGMYQSKRKLPLCSIKAGGPPFRFCFLPVSTTVGGLYLLEITISASAYRSIVQQQLG
jgi:hypothetical protein